MSKLNLSSNLKAQPGDPDYQERSRLEMFATCIGAWMREYHQPPKARLPIGDHEWLYGFYMPKLRIAFPHLVPHDRVTFGGWAWPESAKHTFEP